MRFFYSNEKLPKPYTKTWSGRYVILTSDFNPFLSCLYLTLKISVGDVAHCRQGLLKKGEFKSILEGNGWTALDFESSQRVTQLVS